MSAAPRMRPVVVLLGLLALALNLRTALAGYPPLLETVRGELGVSAGAAGLVQAGAVLMMAVGSFAGSSMGARFGRERALGAAIGLVALGSLTRGVSSLAPLIGGSLLVGFGLGVTGVLLTGVVKEHLASRAGAVTGAYVVAMMAGATVSSAAAVPLAVALGGLVVLPRRVGRAGRARGGGMDRGGAPDPTPPTDRAAPAVAVA